MPSLAGGGAQRVLLTLLRHLDRERFELHLGVVQSTGAYVEDVPRDVVLHDLKVSRVRYALPGIIRLAWKLQPHAMLSTLTHLNMALVLGRGLLPPETRLLVRETTMASAVHPQGKRLLVWEWLYRRFYRRADRIICLSDTMIDDLVKLFGLPREKLVRIYNPVDIARVCTLADLGGNPYTGPGPHLVAVGRLSREKGFDILLHAMPEVLQRFPDAQVSILGEGSLLNDLTEQARQLGLVNNVCFLGFQVNPWPYLKYADVFVLPSRFEGLPNVMLEALVLGVPIVATDCPGGSREIAGSYSGVLMIPPEDVRALAGALIAMCGRSKGHDQNQAEQEDMRNRFGLERALTEYSALLSV